MKNRWKMMMALMLCAGVANAAYVTIGNAGNEADTRDGDSYTAGVQRYGAVGYSYKISATEVTIAEFAASGAGSGNEDYWNDGTRTVGTAAPVTQVTLYEAMKYCNFITSGDVNDGAYVFSAGVYQSTDRASAIAAHGTIYALPTEDEWYKAAYYDASGAGGYSIFANGNNTTPTEGAGATGWNYNAASSSPNYTRDVALGTIEQNGTVNMMGNVAEWVEDSAGVLRGGDYNDYLEDVRSSGRFETGALLSSHSMGIRPVEVVPEPATAGLLGISAIVFYAIRRIKNFNRVV